MRTNLYLVKIQPQPVEIQPNLRFISTCGGLNDRLTFNLPDCHSAKAETSSVWLGFFLSSSHPFGKGGMARCSMTRG